MRGLAGKIWKVLAPSSAAVSAAVSSDPRVKVWIPRRRGYSVLEGRNDQSTEARGRASSWRGCRRSSQATGYSRRQSGQMYLP